MDKRRRIAVVAGGFSGESVVSLKSSETIMRHIDQEKFEPFLVKILKNGWTVEHNGDVFALKKNDFSFQNGEEVIHFDYAFIIIHGTPGEDGLIQSYFDLIGLPYSTGDTALMGLTFDKAYTQSMLKGLGFNVAKNVIVRKDTKVNEEAICSELGLPCFAKPSRAGSSLGVSKVKLASDLNAALNEAFKEFHASSKSWVGANGPIRLGSFTFSGPEKSRNGAMSG